MFKESRDCLCRKTKGERSTDLRPEFPLLPVFLQMKEHFDRKRIIFAHHYSGQTDMWKGEVSR